jgi:predicted enzyme related to lactoylglutathione lyase
MDRSVVPTRQWLHTSLAVSDIDLASSFFITVFGFETVFLERAMSGQIASMTGEAGMTCDLAQLARRDDGQRLELIAFWPAEGAAPVGSPWRTGGAHVALSVDDLVAAIRDVTLGGGRVLGQITEFSDCRAVYCAIPGGAIIELEEPKDKPRDD